MKKEDQIYKRLENKVRIIYPESPNATYCSLLNYSEDLLKPLQRWYRYKEGFSIDLVKELIKEYNNNEKGTILDPFLGSGSTIIAANQLGLKGIGFEINPFSYFLAKCKIREYTSECANEFKKCYERYSTGERIKNSYKMPKLSFADKVFSKEIEQLNMSIKSEIDAYNYKHNESRELLLIGWLACLERLSNYRKAGNGLKRKNHIKKSEIKKDEALNILKNQYANIYKDIITKDIKFSANIYNESCMNIDKKITKKISGIVYSPPYANCFDYTEIYKLELWFGEFIKNYEDIKQLRKDSIRSHINGDFAKREDFITTEPLQELLRELEKKTLWNKKIPKMLEFYYSDMFNVINKCYKVLEDKGFCAIVIANSAYGDIVFPADLLFADYAQQIGFKVDKIEVDRYIITSSQQYEQTKKNKKLLRESVLCLIKE